MKPVPVLAPGAFYNLEDDELVYKINMYVWIHLSSPPSQMPFLLPLLGSRSRGAAGYEMQVIGLLGSKKSFTEHRIYSQERFFFLQKWANPRYSPCRQTFPIVMEGHFKL